tara:strand:- start:104 stop:1210 length:1107 start_codon:yes stop_codon:yes gene_type:complete
MGVKSTGNNRFMEGSNQSFFVRTGGKLIEFASNVFVTGDKSIAGTNEYPTGVSGGTIFQYNGKTIHAFTSSDFFIISGATVINKNCEMVMLGGGGGSCRASGSSSAGGAGAGGMVLYPSITFTNGAYPVVIGAGGAGTPNSESPGHGGSLAQRGGDTTIGVDGDKGARGGGGSFSWGISGTPTEYYKELYLDGGCGGGGGGFSQPAAQGRGEGVNPYTNPGGTEFGHPAGNTATRGVSGGGGIGGAGGNAYPGFPSVSGSDGGVGLQLPATFRDPSNVYGVPGPGGTAHWVGGGGASGSWDTSSASGGGGAGGPYAGGGSGGSPGSPMGTQGGTGTVNTGGGAGGHYNNSGLNGNNGGSGLVLIAYPT